MAENHDKSRPYSIRLRFVDFINVQCENIMKSRDTNQKFAVDTFVRVFRYCDKRFFGPASSWRRTYEKRFVYIFVPKNTFKTRTLIIMHYLNERFLYFHRRRITTFKGLIYPPENSHEIRFRRGLRLQLTTAIVRQRCHSPIVESTRLGTFGLTISCKGNSPAVEYFG